MGAGCLVLPDVYRCFVFIAVAYLAYSSISQFIIKGSEDRNINRRGRGGNYGGRLLVVPSGLCSANCVTQPRPT